MKKMLIRNSNKQKRVVVEKLKEIRIK